MDSNWQIPEEWKQQGIVLSQVMGVRTRAWTTLMTAKETRGGTGGGTGTAGGVGADVVIKAFSVPRDIVQDPQRIALERERFLASARLQKEVAESGAKGWVKVRAISEVPGSVAVLMDRCQASLQEYVENHAKLSAWDLYTIVNDVIDALAEMHAWKGRSHGDLKPSDILACKPGERPMYRLQDPAPEGEAHSANDLYALGQVIYKLIEQRDYDPLQPLLPTKPWDRFGAKRSKWLQFCGLLLNPNGWHEPLARVKKEALALKPVGAGRVVGIAAAGVLVLAAAGAAGVWAYPRMMPMIRGGGSIAGSGGAGNGSDNGLVAATMVSVGTRIDPAAKEELEKARGAFQEARTAWLQASGTPYDHTKSRAMVRQVRDLLPDPTVPIVTAKACRTAAEKYQQAAEVLTKAAETAKGEAQVGEAMSRVKQVSESAYQSARSEYLQLNEQWRTAVRGKRGDFSAANAKAEEAKRAIPDQIVLTNAASYQRATEEYRTAAGKMQEALKLLAEAKGSEASGTGSERAGASNTGQASNSAANGSAVNGDTNSVAAAKAIRNANAALQNSQYAEALRWYEAAGELGNAPAARNAGLLLETGKAGTRNVEEAMKWYQRAADEKYVPALLNLASIYENVEREQNYHKALDCYMKAAGLGSVDAMVCVGNYFENGIGVEEDSKEAMKWYAKAAGLKNSAAMMNIGVLYEKGHGVPLDYAKAIEWFQKAIALNNAAAMNALGALYDNGRGVKQDAAEAMTWYRKAAALNFGPAMTNIGTMYDTGEGVARDEGRAMEWFQKAAAAGDGMGMYNIGVLYETGRGVSQSKKDAVMWYRRAENSGDENARQAALDRLGQLGLPP